MASPAGEPRGKLARSPPAMSLPVTPRRPRPGRRAAGFSMVELMLVLTILTVAVGMLAGTLGSVMRLGPSVRETALAVEAARSAVERMRAAPFGDLFALYNADPGDDPGGAGTAPGAGFAVAGLQARADDPDGLCGEVVLPIAAGALREDLVDVDLGLPRDLDLDGAVDGLDHAGDYEVLPVVVRVRWGGRGAARQVEVFTTIARR